MKFTYDDYGNPVTSEIKPATFERYVQAKSYYIINAHSGNALDASGDNYTVVNKNWIPGNTDQMWTIIGTSTPGVYEVESVKYPGRMLDVTDPNSEAGVGELAEFIAIKCGRIEGTAEHFETVEVSGIVLFEGANEGLHV